MSTSTVNIQEIQTKLYEKLKPSGWADPLKLFIMSQDLRNILSTLYNESSAGRKFTPVLKQVFTAFEECPYDKVKLVILGQDPYTGINIADGMAFSSSNVDYIPPSLKLMHKEIGRTIYNDENVSIPKDLRFLANQGVLLLNTALTTEIGKSDTHSELWKPFIKSLLDTLKFSKPGTLYLFMGNKAKNWHTSVQNDRNFKFFTTHPASAAYSEKEWDSGNVFNQINKVLTNQEKTPIKWTI